MSIWDAIESVDRSEQRKARRELKSILSGAPVHRELLDAVTTVARMKRKPLSLVSISDLIDMGLLEVAS